MVKVTDGGDHVAAAEGVADGVFDGVGRGVSDGSGSEALASAEAPAG